MRHWHTFCVLADAYIHELGESESVGRDVENLKLSAIGFQLSAWVRPLLLKAES
jgi:hypothetical protein